MASYNTITIEAFSRSPRVTDNYDDIQEIQAVEISNVEEQHQSEVMEPVEVDRQDIMWSWQDTSFDFIDRYNKIVNNMTKLFTDLKDTLNYVQDLKVPFCWEYAKLAYSQRFEELAIELQGIDVEIASFPRDLEFHRSVSIERADKGLSESSVNFLENLLGYYADRVTSVTEDLEHTKKIGMNAVIASQQIYTNCGEFQF